MPGGRSGGLAEAMRGETYTGVSEDHPEPPRAKCRWNNCPTSLRIGNRPRIRKLAKEKPEVVPDPPEPIESSEPAEPFEQTEAASEESADAAQRKYTKQKDVSKNLEGLCDLHKRMVQDYDLGLSVAAAPF